METRRSNRDSLERRRRQRRRRSMLRWLVFLGCAAVIVLVVLFAVRGCGSGAGAAGADGSGGTSTSTHSGSLLGIDRQTGVVVWKKALTPHAWASCVVVDKILIVGDTYGVLHAWDVSNTRIDPPVVWELTAPSKSALESTVAVWKGRIYLGCRDGYFYCFEDQ